MANTKISALTPGTPAQSTDVLPIDRAGANFSLTASDIIGGAAPANVVSTAGTMTSGNVITGAGTKVVQDGGVALSALAPLASPTFTGTVTAPTIKSTKSITTGLNAMGNVTGSGVSIDLSLGNVITMTLTGNVTSSSFANAVASAGQDVTFIITQNGTGGYTLTWPTAVVPAGVAPAPSLAANSVSVFKATIDASGNANFTGNGPITVFRFRNASVTTSVGASVIFTPAAAGVYRLQGQVSCTTAGTTATMALTIYINNTAFHITSSALGSSSTTGFYESVVYPQLNMAASSASNIDYATTLTNAIGTAVFQVDITIEYLGN